MLASMTPSDDLPQSNGRRRAVWVVVALVLAGGLLTWLAFGVGIDKAPADPTHGVDLVEPHERSTGPSR